MSSLVFLDESNTFFFLILCSHSDAVVRVRWYPYPLSLQFLAFWFILGSHFPGSFWCFVSLLTLTFIH